MRSALVADAIVWCMVCEELALPNHTANFAHNEAHDKEQKEEGCGVQDDIHTQPPWVN